MSKRCRTWSGPWLPARPSPTGGMTSSSAIPAGASPLRRTGPAPLCRACSRPRRTAPAEWPRASRSSGRRPAARPSTKTGPVTTCGPSMSKLRGVRPVSRGDIDRVFQDVAFGHAVAAEVLDGISALILENSLVRHGVDGDGLTRSHPQHRLRVHGGNVAPQHLVGLRAEVVIARHGAGCPAGGSRRHWRSARRSPSIRCPRRWTRRTTRCRRRPPCARCGHRLDEPAASYSSRDRLGGLFGQ